MTIWWLGCILGVLGASAIAFVWLIVRLGRLSAAASHTHQSAAGDYVNAAEEDVAHIFNAEFREELRNRGRLHFEKIIGENAMFLQQDLRLTTSQLNEYMKAEITRKLEDAFKTYEQSINDARQLAIESIKKTTETIEAQRAELSQQVQTQIEAERAAVLKRFEDNMGKIVTQYLEAAIGNEIDLSDQMEYILRQLEANKAAILEDIKRGA